jgi:hypothetical protein
MLAVTRKISWKREIKVRRRSGSIEDFLRPVHQHRPAKELPDVHSISDPKARLGPKDSDAVSCIENSEPTNSCEPEINIKFNASTRKSNNVRGLTTVGQASEIALDLPESRRIPSPPPEEPLAKSDGKKASKKQQLNAIFVRPSPPAQLKSQDSLAMEKHSRATLAIPAAQVAVNSSLISRTTKPQKYYSPFETGLHVELPTPPKPCAHQNGRSVCCNFSSSCHASHHGSVKVQRPPAFQYAPNFNHTIARSHPTNIKRQQQQQQQEFSLFDKRLSSIFGRSPK